MNMNMSLLFLVEMSGMPTERDKTGCEGLYCLGIHRVDLPAILRLLEEAEKFREDVVEPYRFKRLIDAAQNVRDEIVKLD